MEKPNKTEHALCSKETSTQIQDSERQFSFSFDNQLMSQSVERHIQLTWLYLAVDVRTKGATEYPDYHIKCAQLRCVHLQPMGCMY